MKNKIKKIAVASLCAVMLSTNVVAEEVTSYALPENGGIVQPMYVGISLIDSNVSINLSGVASFYAITQSKPGYTSYVSATLEQYNGSSWVPLKTWSQSGSVIVKIEDTYSVSRGYKYRLTSVHKSYNSNGVKVDETTSTSLEVFY